MNGFCGLGWFGWFGWGPEGLRVRVRMDRCICMDKQLSLVRGSRLRLGHTGWILGREGGTHSSFIWTEGDTETKVEVFGQIGSYQGSKMGSRKRIYIRVARI